MKKLLIGGAALIALLVAAALIVPSFINWNDYKGQIIAEVEKRTGRALVIGGDIGLTLLPSPAVIVTDLRLGNLAGGEAEDMVKLRSLEVKVAFGPLLQGRIQVEKVKLVDPVVQLETLADGRNNWEFSEPAESGEPGTAPVQTMSAPSPSNGDDRSDMPVSVQFDSLEIENGLVVYRDAAAGGVERIDDLNAIVAADSLRGPFEGEGDMTARGLRTGFRITLGQIDPEQPVPVSLVLTPEPGKARLELRGKASDIGASPSFTGGLEAKAENLAELIRAVGGGGGSGGVPEFLAQSVELAGEVTASASRVDVSGLSVHLGKTGATGAVSARLNNDPAVSAHLAIAHLNLDSWLELTAPKSEEPEQRSDTAPRPRSQAATGSETPASAPAGGAVGLPADLTVSLVVSAEAITYRRGIIRNARVNAELAEGEITVSQISGDLPGATALAAFGFVTMADGDPRFEGYMDVKAGDVRGLLGWLEVDTRDLAPGRLRTVELKSKLAAKPGALRLYDMDLGFDASRVTGQLSLDLAGKPAFGADVAVDRIDVDAYLPLDRSDPNGGADGPAAATEKGPPDQPAKSVSKDRKKRGLDGLADFDAKFKARVERLTYKGTPFETVVLDGTLMDGVLDVGEASVGNVAGASGRLSGIIEPLAQPPGMKRLSFEFDVPSLDRLLRALNLPRPDPIPTLAPFAVSGTTDGPFVNPTVDVKLHAAGGETILSGVLDAFPRPGFSGRMKFDHVDLVQVLGSLGAGYRPTGQIGRLDLAASVVADGTQVNLTGLDGAIGDTSLTGSINAKLAGKRPAVVADLKIGRLVIDPYLPAKRTAQATPRLIPASWSGTPEPRYRRDMHIHVAADTLHQRWSRESLDLSVLKAMDADLTLKSDGVAYERYEFEDVDAVAKLADGVLNIEPLTGRLFHGPARAKLRLDANRTPRLDADMTVKNADLARATRDGKGRPAATGRMAFDTNVTTRGLNAADLVAGLDGSGSLRLTDVEAGEGSVGGGVAPVINLLQQLNGIGAGLGASRARAEVTATFRIEDGLIRTDDIALESGLGDGGARGVIDLPGWHMDVGGEIHLRSNIITGLMIETIGPPIVPFRIRGPVDDPNVTVDASSLKVRRLVIPDPKDLDAKKGLKALRKLFNP